jgi:hypothetical protein
MTKNTQTTFNNPISYSIDFKSTNSQEISNMYRTYKKDFVNSLDIMSVGATISLASAPVGFIFIAAGCVALLKANLEFKVYESALDHFAKTSEDSFCVDVIGHTDGCIEHS